MPPFNVTNPVLKGVVGLLNSVGAIARVLGLGPLTVVPPPKVFAPLKVNVPVPDLTSARHR